MNEPLRIYIASAFFNDPIFRWTDDLANSLEEKFGEDIELYVPQRNDEINDKENGGTDISIYKVDIQDQLLQSDLLIANLDGDDAGVNGEVLAAAMHNELVIEDNITHRSVIPIIGLTTDMRYGAKGDDHFYINKLVVGAIKSWGKFIEGKPSRREEYLNEIYKSVGEFIDDKKGDK